MDSRKITDQTINIDNNFGNSFWLEYSDTDMLNTEKQIRFLEFSFRSLFSFLEDWVEPTSIDVSFGCCEPYTGEATDIPVNGDSSYTYLSNEATAHIRSEKYRSNSIFVNVENFTKQNLLDDAREFLQKGFSCEDETYFPGWGEVSFRSGKYLIKAPFIRKGNCEVTYNRGHAWYDYPAENNADGYLVAAPLSNELCEPVSASISNLGYKMDFHVQLNWSYYYDDHMPGKQLMKEAIARLGQMGWKLVGGRGFVQE